MAEDNTTPENETPVSADTGATETPASEAAAPEASPIEEATPVEEATPAVEPAPAEAPAEVVAEATEPAAAEAAAPEAPPVVEPKAELPKGPKSFLWGTGRRKSSVARVRITPGSGKIQINGRELNDYLTGERDRKAIFGPLEVTSMGGKLDIFVNANGGGLSSQAGAIVLGIARALSKFDPSLETNLRHAGYMTRDDRMKERKKYGQRGARRRFQFSKR